MSKPTKPTKATLEAQLDEARKQRQALDKTTRRLEAQLRAQARQEHDRLALTMGRVALAAGLRDLAQDLDTLRGAFRDLAQRATDPHQCAQWRQQGQAPIPAPATPTPVPSVVPSAAFPSAPETLPLATTTS
jgi:hypothetical protein